MDNLCASLFAKVDEQLERTGHLAACIPEDQLGWAPAIPGAWPTGLLLGHLLDCAAGFCATLAAAEPGLAAPLAALRALPVNHFCGPVEARERLATYRARVAEGFSRLRDAGLGRKVATVFVPEGESALTLILGNLEHLINHKHQLFTYLKLMGRPVGTADLYQLRGSPPYHEAPR
jgi:DinB family protein